MSATATTRPSIEQVALLIRSRTKDSNGLEVGTFDGDTRPTAEQVELFIDQASALVTMQLPAATIPAELAAAAAAVIALEAACSIEKAYWPEQARSDRSPYALLKVEYDEALAALRTAVEAGGPAGLGARAYASLPVGSWTSLPGSFIAPPGAAP
jgi:hypothetical protein